mmetsp:Transcript_16883/g.29739  ORF Transcript_16883/g.29739 Transcript_16883/m.29739 type:complete len:123 (-) Transcript_16883:793-1161(-)
MPPPLPPLCWEEGAGDSLPPLPAAAAAAWCREDDEVEALPSPAAHSGAARNFGEGAGEGAGAVREEKEEGRGSPPAPSSSPGAGAGAREGARAAGGEGGRPSPAELWRLLGVGLLVREEEAC